MYNNIILNMSVDSYSYYMYTTLWRVLHRRQSWGMGVSRPPDFGLGVVGVAGGRGRVVKHYYTLSCTGSMVESGNFPSEIE